MTEEQAGDYARTGTRFDDDPGAIVADRLTLVIAVRGARDNLDRAIRRLREHDAKRREANPITPEKLDQIRGIVETYLADWRTPTERSTVELAYDLTHYRFIMLSQKTLQNVYLPALREGSPHAVQRGRKWVWGWNIAQASREAGQ